MILTPLALRWRRAQRISPARIVMIDASRAYMPSASGGYYITEAKLAGGRLVKASCSCADYLCPMSGKGEPRLREVRVCKHILALALALLSD